MLLVTYTVYIEACADPASRTGNGLQKDTVGEVPYLALSTLSSKFPALFSLVNFIHLKALYSLLFQMKLGSDLKSLELTSTSTGQFFYFSKLFETGDCE